MLKQQLVLKFLCRLLQVPWIRMRVKVEALQLCTR
jgi:hypothetical protein